MIISSYTIIFQPTIVHPTCLFHTAQLFDSEEYLKHSVEITEIFIYIQHNTFLEKISRKQRL